MTKGIRMKVTPDLDRVKRDLKKRREKMSSLKTTMSRVATFLDRWVQDNFKTEGGKVGGWKPLARGGRLITRGGRTVLDKSAKILQDTGRLRNSFLPFASMRNAGIGSKLDYSKKHNEGIDVVKRRILPTIAEVRKPIREHFNVHVKRSLSLR